MIGGELWNEPFPGDVFGRPEMRNNQFADKNNLSPFYTNITTAIREAVPDQTKFVSPCAGWLNGVPQPFQ